MAPLALLLLFAVTAYMLLWRTRPDPPPQAPGHSLEALDLRSLDAALAPARAAADDDEAAVLYALVLVDGDPTLDLPAIVQSVRRRSDLAPTPVASGEHDPPLRRTLALGSGAIAIELIAPVGEEPVFDNTEANAGADVTAHTAAVLVAVESDQQSLDQAVALSHHVLALLETCPQATAVLWASSRNLWSAGQAKRALDTDYAKQVPMTLWVSARTGTHEDGRVQGYTLGLKALGGTEFEALDAQEGPRALQDRLHALAEYSMLSCKTIFNGDTTGVDFCERIRLQKLPSQTVHRGWVFQLRYLRPSPRQPWESE